MEWLTGLISIAALVVGYYLNQRKTKNQEFLDAVHKAQKERDRAVQESTDALSKHDYDLGRDLDSLLKKNHHDTKR